MQFTSNLSTYENISIDSGHEQYYTSFSRGLLVVSLSELAVTNPIKGVLRMNASPHYLLSQEWRTLHQEHDRYDRYSLLIKLTAVLVCLLSLKLAIDIALSMMLISILWLQEGIWRTIQARATERLLAIEKMLEHPENQPAMQFYSTWEAKRPGMIGLIKECLANTAQPAVAYPYVILLAIVIGTVLT